MTGTSAFQRLKKLRRSGAFSDITTVPHISSEVILLHSEVNVIESGLLEEQREFVDANELPEDVYSVPIYNTEEVRRGLVNNDEKESGKS